VVFAHDILHQVHLSKEPDILLKVDFQKPFDYVNWNYLITCFRHMSFSQKWISWIQKILWGGRVNVIINGVFSNFFECRRGVRQGGSLSPLLFILAAEGLHKLIQQAIKGNHIKGLGLVLPNGFFLVNLKYVDDTIIFIQANRVMVEKIKWIFYAFQEISGLQINFSKTELIPLNLSFDDANFYCNILQCKLDKLPIKYLGER
jgi:Reverse transcriptase (RNA-dependent DNA polymerase)